jgi:hypothetical protein
MGFALDGDYVRPARPIFTRDGAGGRAEFSRTGSGDVIQ